MLDTKRLLDQFLDLPQQPDHSQQQAVQARGASQTSLSGLVQSAAGMASGNLGGIGGGAVVV
jgi:hypothetical protein